MLTEHTVAEVARAAGLAELLQYRAVTASTNSDVLDLAESGAPEWTTVVAGHQEAGRGRLVRTWVSRPGASLLVSTLLRPSVNPSAATLLSLAAGVAAAEACEASCGVVVRCKWPNDLMAGTGGRKVGGILVEGRVTNGRLVHVVVGLGVNVRQSRRELPADLRDTATSIAIEGGRPDLARLLGGYLVRLRGLYAPDDPVFRVPLLHAYRERSQTLGRRVLAITSDGEEVEGLAEAIGDDGQLLIRDHDGALHEIAFGEVQNLR